MIGRRADGDSYLNQTYNAEWDWVFVRGYSSVVPTIVSGEEENILLQMILAQQTFY
jgi:hypothetical protein